MAGVIIRNGFVYGGTPVDNEITATSDYPVSSKAIKNALDGITERVADSETQIDAIQDLKAEKYIPSSDLPECHSWVGDTNTILSGSYYYHEIPIQEWIDKQTCFTLFRTLKVMCLGIGSTPENAIQNQYSVKEVSSRFGNKVYVSTALITPAATDHIYVFYAAADVYSSVGTSGLVYTAIQNDTLNGTIDGFFGDLPMSVAVDWLDSRISTIESQIDGFSVGANYIMVNGIRVYVSSTTPTGTIPEGSLGIGF